MISFLIHKRLVFIRLIIQLKKGSCYSNTVSTMIRIHTAAKDNNYKFTPERRDGLDGVPAPPVEEKLILLKFKALDVEVLAAAADISDEIVVTFPAKALHFSWVFCWQPLQMNRGTSFIHLE